jgi:ABC-type phosphate/phosphonate transport system substrate-binding protein
MRSLRVVLATMLAVLAMVGAAGATDPSWPKEVTFGLLSTENAAERP